MIFFSDHPGRPDVRMSPGMSYTVLALDRDYITNEMLPALAQQHFRQTGDGVDYQLAVVSIADREPVYHSTGGFCPSRRQRSTRGRSVPGSHAGLWVDCLGDSAVHVDDHHGLAATGTGLQTFREQIVLPPRRQKHLDGARHRPLSIIVQQNGSAGSMAASAAAAAATRMTGPGTPRWRLLVIHPSGSLESAVNAARRRNLVVSSSILAVLGASMGLLVFSTRRAQELARQQMEFVAAVSHELRTPLAVIRSAGENLADGVVRDEEQFASTATLCAMRDGG
jgi:signal transduction histidine kinase